MLKWFHKLSLVYQISSILLTTTLVGFLAFTVVVAVDTNRNILKHSTSQLDGDVDLVVSMLAFYDQTLRHDTLKLGDIFFRVFPGRFELNPSRRVPVGAVQGPALMHDGELLNARFAAVDRFSEMTGGVATVFARDGDDFLRVTTSLKNQQGGRAMGTRLGQGHPGYAQLMRGEEYFGHANLFGREYMTRYIPVRDRSDQVVAILFVGFDYTEGMASLKKTVEAISVAGGGQAMILDLAADKQGVWVSHGWLAGRTISDLMGPGQDALIERLYQDRRGSFYYTPAQDPTNGGERLIAFRFVPEWDWLVMAEAPVRELAAVGTAIRNRLVLLGAILIGVLTLVIWWVLKKELAPIADFVPVLDRIGSGSLGERLTVNGQTVERADMGSSNEMRALAAHVNQMVGRFGELVTDVKHAVTAVGTAATQLNAAAQANSDGTATQQAETDALASAITEMAASVQEVASNAREAADETMRSNELAGAGRETMQNTVGTINEIAEDISGSAGLMHKVREESQAIGSVLDVIRGIAEQTNLLALNAAIEAARAGEQGRGFAVVADEVRSLAQRSQSSTTEIQEIIVRLQSSVEQAVQNMDRGRSRSEESVGVASEAAAMLEAIIESISHINEMNAQVAAATDEQSAVANEVNRSITSIKQVAEQSAHASSDTLGAVGELQALALRLEQKVATFQV